MSELEIPSIFCDTASTNARSIFAGLGFRLVANPEDADLIWARQGYEELQSRLEEFQLINHIPNERTITNKGALTENLKRYDRAQSKYGFALKDFYQETYCLDDVEDRSRFFDQVPPEDQRDNLWIMKPTGSSRGRGIKILWQLNSLKAQFEDPMGTDAGLADQPYIIQRYIKNPLLLDGRKSELRIYWLIASLDPLLVLMYKEGTVRLNSHPFRLEDFDNTLIHVTNVYQQKIHPGFDPSVILKWSFSDWERYLVEERKIARPDFVTNELKPRLRRCLAFVVDSARAMLAQCPGKGLHFGLFGADVILDDTLCPWLAEVQKGPGLSHDDPVKRQLLPDAVGEAARIALEIRRRKRHGESLAELDAVRNFEWVIREA